MSAIRAIGHHVASDEDNPMTAHLDISASDVAGDRTAPSSVKIHWRWLGVWAFLATFVVFEVVKHGFVFGSAAQAVALTVTAVGCFIAPDLTFLIGAGQPVPRGHIATQAVRWYNALHRMWVPLVLTSVIGVVLAPLAFGALAAFIGGLSWMAHIALDRAAGYGLRHPDGSRNQT